MRQEYPLDRYLVELRRIEAHRTRDVEREIRKVYRDILRDLQGMLGVESARYGVDGVLTYADLQRAGEYARFLEEVERKLGGLSPQISSLIRSTVDQAYTASYAGMVRAVTSSVPLHISLAGVRGVTPEIVRRAVDNPIAGLTLKDTLEHNRQAITYNIKRQVGVGLTQGDRYTTVAKRIANSLDQDYRKSLCIVRTETHRVIEGGHLDAALEVDQALRDAGMRMIKTWRTMADERVRPGRGIGKKPRRGKANHQKMDGIMLEENGEFDLGHGVKTLAPGQSGDAANDINCRCYLDHSVEII